MPNMPFFILIKYYVSFIVGLAKDCGPIESPTNGSLFFGDRTTYPHIVLFSCDKGFLLKGSNLRRCTSEGVWSGMPASCEGTFTVIVNMWGNTIGSNMNTGDIFFVNRTWAMRSNLTSRGLTCIIFTICTKRNLLGTYFLALQLLLLVKVFSDLLPSSFFF